MSIGGSMRLHTSMIEWGGALDDLIGHSIT